LSGWFDAQNTPSEYVLQSADRRQVYREALNRGNWPWRHWDNRYLVVHGVSSKPDSPIIKVFGSDGALVSTGTVWFPSAATVSVRGVTTDTSGRVIASGASLSTDGALADFITKLDYSGHPAETIQTNPYIPFRVCATGDGTVWALGNDRDAERHKRDNLILRQFDMSGGQLRALIDAQSLGERHVDPESMWLVCNNSVVGILLEPVRKWIEFDIRTDQTSVWTLPDLGIRRRITGLALTKSGRLVASVYDNSRAQTLVGLFVLSTREPAQGQAVWQGVTGSLGIVSKQPDAASELLGADGDNLVYVGGGTEGDVVYWASMASAR